MLKKLLSDSNIAQAYRWLCRQRQHFPANADIWHFRFNKTRLLKQLKRYIASHQYRYSPLQVIEKQDGDRIALWSAQDALVLKMLAQVLPAALPCHASCVHLKGHGGGKKSVATLHAAITEKSYKFVCRTDIKGYYANIDKQQLLEQLACYIGCPIILNLLGQFLHYSVEDGGNFHTPKKGISRGCALSPLLAGFQLYCVDQYFSDWCQEKGCHYVRYMDDFLILTTTRWQLRRAVKRLNQFFNEFGFIQHPAKTFIGRLDKGFDFLGYQFNRKGLCGAAPRALDNFAAKLRRLYEQAQQLGLNKTQTERRVAQYRKRWQQWLRAGLGNLPDSDRIRATLNLNGHGHAGGHGGFVDLG